MSACCDFDGCVQQSTRYKWLQPPIRLTACQGLHLPSRQEIHRKGYQLAPPVRASDLARTVYSAHWERVAWAMQLAGIFSLSAMVTPIPHQLASSDWPKRAVCSNPEIDRMVMNIWFRDQMVRIWFASARLSLTRSQQMSRWNAQTEVAYQGF